MAGSQSFLSVVARDEVHLQFRFKESVDVKSLMKAIGSLWENETTGIGDPTLNENHQLAGGSANIVVGFRPEFWKNISPETIPDNLNGYNEDIVGSNGMISPATQLDLWVWITQSSAATLFDSMKNAISILEPYADLVSEQICFPYHNNVTFDGFADGVANPNPFRANEVAIVPNGKKGEGGSTVLVQKWTMEIDKLRTMSVYDAERVYGRTKAGSHELSPLPDDSHVGKTQFRRNGKEIDIVRRNSNFGNSKEAGIMFVGFSNDISVTMEMLRQMYGAGEDGNTKTDKLINFSKAISSAIYFVPSIDALQKTGASPKDGG